MKAFVHCAFRALGPPILAGLGCAPSAFGVDLPPQQVVAADAGGRAQATPDAGHDAAAAVDEADASNAGQDAASVDAVAESTVDGRDAGASANAASEGGEAASGAADSGEAIQGAVSDAPPYTGPPRPPAVCSPTAVVGDGTLLAVSTPSDDMLDSVTPDELSIAWTVGDGSLATLVYADRADVGSPFGPPQTVTPGPFATDRAALSPDGLRLVVVGSDGMGFLELTRTSRTAPGNAFGPPNAGSLANLTSPGTLAAGQTYGDPVVGADDVTFYYTVNDAAPSAFRAGRLLPTDAWPAGAPLRASGSVSGGGVVVGRPTGISSDGMSLFFRTLSSATGIQLVAWLDVLTGDFDVSVDLAPRVSVAPSRDCHRLYYSAQGAGSVDLFVAAQ